MITAEPATIHHALALAPHLREQDKLEVMRSSGRKPTSALVSSLLASDWAGAVVDGGGFVVAIFGLAGLTTEVGAPWLLASDDLAKDWRTFLRESRGYVKEMHRFYPSLMNYVDVENKVAIRWLTWCGFRLLPPVPRGPLGHPFYPFVSSTCAT